MGRSRGLGSRRSCPLGFWLRPQHRGKEVPGIPQLQRVEGGKLGPWGSCGASAQPFWRHGVPEALPPPQLVSSLLQGGSLFAGDGRSLGGWERRCRVGAG